MCARGNPVRAALCVRLLTGGAGVTLSTDAPTPNADRRRMRRGASGRRARADATSHAIAATGITFAVVVTDVSGTLAATASAAGHCQQPASNVLT